MIKVMLKAYYLDRRTSWLEVLPLMEFAYNNNYQETIKMALYKALYGRKCKSLLHWDEIGKRDALI